MKVTANGREITVAQISENYVTIGGESRPSLAIAIEGGVTSEDVEALKSGVIIVDEGYKTYKGFVGYIDTEVLLYKPTDADLSHDYAADLEQRMINMERKMREKEALYEEKEAEFTRRQYELESSVAYALEQRDEARAQVQEASQQLMAERQQLLAERQRAITAEKSLAAAELDRVETGGIHDDLQP